MALLVAIWREWILEDDHNATTPRTPRRPTPEQPAEPTSALLAHPPGKSR